MMRSIVRKLAGAALGVALCAASANAGLYCGDYAANATYGPLASCYSFESTGTYTGLYSGFTKKFSRQLGPLTLLDGNFYAGNAKSSDNSGTFLFVGGPKVKAYGPTSYGEQRWSTQQYGPLVRWGNYNFTTGLFYPSSSWMQDLGTFHP